MRRRRFWIVVLLLTLPALLPWQTARADTYLVTNTNDSGPGSLRQAITEANNHPGSDTITFTAATDGIPIVLAGAAYENSNASGDLDILDGGNLTIQGNGPANTIIDGGRNDRVFDVCPGGSCANTVTFNGVTIQNGRSLGFGGGILNRGATLNVQNSTIGGAAAFGNEAVGGGGIFTSAGGTTMVDSSTVDSNTASYGGGIYNYVGCTTTLNGSIVRDNAADVDGGGIYNQATLNVQNGSTIGGAGAGNTADNNGGGIYNSDGNTTTVDSSSVSANTARGDGGGIYNNDGTLNVQNGSTVGEAGAGNTAENDGGGIYNDGTLTLDNSIVEHNSADSFGGGIRNDGTLTLNKGRVTSNSSDWCGGGIVNMGTLTLHNSTVSYNTADYSFDYTYGGGIYNNGTLTLYNSTLDHNSAFYGGGIYHNAGTLTLDNCTVHSNSAGRDGGGIYTWDTLTLFHTTIASNRAGEFFMGDGGGIYVSSGTTNVMNTIIGDNQDSRGEAQDCSGTLTSWGYNLLESGAGCTIVGDTTGNINGADPNLGVCHDHGGPTYTCRLQTGSPAIERIPTGASACWAGVSTDQRGYVRAGGPGNGGFSCDIGAYEYDTVPLPPSTGLIYLPIISKN